MEAVRLASAADDAGTPPARPGADACARSDAAHWKRNLAVCVFGSFTTLLSLSMLLPFLPLYVRQLGIAGRAAVIQWSAVAFVATFLGTAVTAPLWGHLADRYGRKPMLVRAALGMMVAMSLIGMAQSITQLVLLRLAAGLVGGYASASTVMIGTQAPPERAGWALGMLSTGALAGTLVGPLAGGFLPGWVGIRGTFFVGGGLIAVAAVLTILLVREDFTAPVRARGGTGRAGTGRVAADRGMLAALLATGMMVLFANMSVEPIITVYVGGLHPPAGRVAGMAGIVMAASAVGSMATASWLGALADRVGTGKVILGGLLTGAATLLPQAFVTQWWQLAVLRCLMGMGVAGLLPAVAKTLRGAADPGQLGKVLGYLQSSQFAGQVLGPLVGGVVGAHMGLRHVFFVTSGLLLACAWLNRRFVRVPFHGGDAA